MNDDVPRRFPTAGLLVLPLLLTACSVPVPTPSATSPGRPSASGPPTPVVISTASGVDQLMYDDPQRPVNVQWPVVPGADALTNAMRTWVTGLGTKFLAESRASDVAPPELQGTWETLRLGGGLAGVRLSIYEFVGVNGANYSRTFYGDTRSDAAWSGTALIKPDQLAAAAAAIVAAAKASGKTVFEEPLDAVASASLVNDLTFDQAGDLIVRVPQGVFTPYSQGSFALSLPATTSDAFLTDTGRRIQAAFVAAPGATTPSTTTTTTTTTTTSAPAPGASVDCTKLKCVALTFDDGPGPHTASILDTLKAKGVKATFFEIGTSVRTYSQVVTRQVAEGHVIGSHTWDHKQLTKMDAGAQASEIDRAADAIAAAGAPRPTIMRPPYGSYNAATKGLGWPIILWNVDSEDWKNRNAAATTALIMKEVRRGSIVLMHDIWPSTAEALPGIIDQLRAQGYTFVTVPQLTTITPGKVISGQKV